MNDDNYCRFVTEISKHGDEAEVLDFCVSCREFSQASDEPIQNVATLKGFLFQPGYLPEDYDDGYFDIFDMRSGHAAEAFRILIEEKTLVSKAISPNWTLDVCGAVAHLERAWVDPAYRQRGLALRLMREAQHVLGRYGLLVILKAHPDGEGISRKDCLKLAAYYETDNQLGLTPISKRNHPGWLVSVWDDPVVHPKDEAYLLD